jgi:hypothetical protein
MTTIPTVTLPTTTVFPSSALQVGLHFFEPRYKLLIKRAMATDKTFIYCARPPLSAAATNSFNLDLAQARSQPPPRDRNLPPRRRLHHHRRHHHHRHHHHPRTASAH